MEEMLESNSKCVISSFLYTSNERQTFEKDEVGLKDFTTLYKQNDKSFMCSITICCLNI